MSARAATAAPPADLEQSRERRRRHRAQIVVSSWFDVGLSLLALLMLGLLIVELTADLSDEWSSRIAATQLGIWGIFIVAFAVELALAADKRRFLRRNWIVVIALVVPIFRVLRVFAAFRILRTARLARTLTIVRGSTTVNRAVNSAREFVRISQFAWVLLATAVVTVTGAAAAYFLERGAEGTPITSFGEALWWSATIITTVNSPLETVTFEGRMVGLILRVFGITAIGYITARLAAFFIGQRGEDAAESRALRDEIARLREELQKQR